MNRFGLVKYTGSLKTFSTKCTKHLFSNDGVSLFFIICCKRSFEAHPHIKLLFHIMNFTGLMHKKNIGYIKLSLNDSKKAMERANGKINNSSAKYTDHIFKNT